MTKLSPASHFGEIFLSMNSISESYKTTHMIPLDFKAVLGLPDSHTWTPIPDYPPDNPLTTNSVPVIDLYDPNAVSLIRHACERFGVFQVINHGISMDLLNELELQTRRLFSLPADRKLRAVRSPDGFTGYGLPRISTFFPKMMWSEGFSIMGSPVEHARQLWPHDHTNFCNVMEAYQREIKGLSEKMIGLVLGSLGLTSVDTKWVQPRNWSRQTQDVIQLNSYPVCPDPTRAMGLAPHTDSSLLTLLYQSNDTGGLQVLVETLGWVPVNPISGAIVVNVGDLMHILSNARFKSAVHRAAVNKMHHRVSIAYFHGPPSDVKVSPLTQLTDIDHPPLYRPVTWKEYLDAKATHFNKALEVIRNNDLRKSPSSSSSPPPPSCTVGPKDEYNLL